MKLIFILMFLTLNLQSQVLTPIVFDNLNPFWSHYSNIEGLEDSINDYIALKPLIIDNDVFFTHNLKNVYVAGHLIEKVNLSDGKKVWNFHYIAPDSLNREYGQIPSYENGNLALATFREIKDNSSSQRNVWRKADIYSRILDEKNGSVIKENKLKARVNITRRQELENVFFDSVLCPKGDSISYFVMVGTEVVSRFESGTFLNSPYFFNGLASLALVEIVSQNLIKSTGDSIFVLRHYNERNDDVNLFRLKISCLNLNLDMIFDYNLEEIVKEEDTFELIYANKSDFLIVGKSIPENSEFSNYTFYHFNVDGELIEKLKIPNESKMLNIETGIILKDSKQILLVGSDFDKSQDLVFFKSDGNGNVEILRHSKSTKLSDRFSCREILQLNDRDLLVNLAFWDVLNPNFKRSVWIKLSSENLGLYLDNKDLGNSKKSNLQIYPNPAVDEIYIQSIGEIPKEIIIYNAFGQLIDKLPFLNSLNIKEYPSGLYYCDFKNKNGETIDVQKLIKL